MKQLKPYTPLQAIKLYCTYGCKHGNHQARKDCNAFECFLTDYRNGTNPHLKKTPSEEYKEVLRQRVKHARDVKNKVVHTKEEITS